MKAGLAAFACAGKRVVPEWLDVQNAGLECDLQSLTGRGANGRRRRGKVKGTGFSEELLGDETLG